MFDCESKISTMRCVLLMNKQFVELLFIKKSTVINHQILQIITQYTIINYKLTMNPSYCFII